MAESSPHAMEAIRRQATRDFSQPSIGRKLVIGGDGVPRVEYVGDRPVEKPADPIKTSGYNLMPPEPLGEVARVFQIGADKYKRRGWEEPGMPWSEVVDRAYRHLGRWIRGEKFDLEDGQHNLASVAWAAMVLMEYEKTHPELDDVHARPSL